MENHDTNAPYYFLLMSVVMVIIAILGHFHEEDNKELYKHYSDNPTAGIVRYMSTLERACMDGVVVTENDIKETEAAINTVAASLVVEEEPIDIPEEEVEYEREQCLINYFGYVPADAAIACWMQAVMDESGNTEPDTGITAVADVIANRVRDPRYPNTIEGVVYQPGQFQPVGDGTFGRFQITERVEEICSDCISNGVTYPYLYFRTNRYHIGRTPGEQIGAHYFSY